MSSTPNQTGAGKCPVMHGSMTKMDSHGTSVKDWWPNQLNLNILHQHAPKSNPLGDFVGRSIQDRPGSPSSRPPNPFRSGRCCLGFRAACVFIVVAVSYGPNYLLFPTAAIVFSCRASDPKLD